MSFAPTVPVVLTEQDVPVQLRLLDALA